MSYAGLTQDDMNSLVERCLQHVIRYPYNFDDTSLFVGCCECVTYGNQNCELRP